MPRRSRDRRGGHAPGPDLTHVASRRTLGAGMHENNRANLTSWIADAQAMKPGNRMPPTDLGDAQIRAVVAYLELSK